METVSVSDDNVLVKVNNGRLVLHKRLNCTCGWSTEELTIRTESRAKHHLRFRHGRGRLLYGGMTQDVV